MKIINFINSAEFNQLRLNMGAVLVKRIDSNYVQKPLDVVKNHIFLKKLASNNSSSLYSKDKSNPKIFHPVKN